MLQLIEDSAVYPQRYQINTIDFYIQIVSDTQRSYSWPNNLVFQGKQLVYLEALTIDDLENDLEGRANISLDNFLNGSVTLVDQDNSQRERHIPLIDLNPRLNNGRQYFTHGILPITGNCLVQFAPAADTTLTAGTVVMLRAGFINEEQVMVPLREWEKLQQKRG